MCYHIRASIRPVRKVRSKMSKLFFRLLPAALSYLVLRVCLTLSRVCFRTGADRSTAR